MPRPLNPLDLIARDHPRDAIDYARYIRHFAAFDWTYTAGVHEVVAHFPIWNPGLPTLVAAKEFVKGFRGQALLNVSPEWRKAMDQGNWTQCNQQKISIAALPGALRFDKGSIAVLAVDLALQALRIAPGTKVPEFDLYEFISLRPAIFVIDGLREREKALLKNDRLINGDVRYYQRLRNKFAFADANGNAPGEDSAETKASRFLNAVADGYGMTHHNAVIIRDYFAEIGLGNLTIRLLDGRNDGGRMVRAKSPNAYEPVHITVDPLNKAGIAGLIVPQDAAAG